MDTTVSSQRTATAIKILNWGLPWWSSGQDCVLPLQRAKVNPWLGN